MSNYIAPQLRFPTFSEQWETKTLDDIAQFSKGKGISKADIDENGTLECIRYGELYTEYGETIRDIKSKTNLKPADLVLSEKNDVIIPASGETKIDIATASCVLKDGVALGGDLNIIKSSLDGVFLSYYLNYARKKEIANFAQGISVVHLYSSQLKKLELNIPQIEEQQKITSFLTAIENHLLLLEKKKKALEKYKKGVMKKIFDREIRFKDENGDEFPEWEEKSLGEIGQTYNGLTGKSKEDFGSGKPYVQYKQIFDNSKIDITKFELVSISEYDNQNKVLFGDVFFTVSSETPNEIGMSSVLLDKIDELYLNSFCFGFRPNSLEILNPLFSRYLFRSELVRNEIVKLAQGSTRYNMSKIQLLKIKIHLPKPSEQIKIANFLCELDDIISFCNQQIEKMIFWKNGLLQKMFV